MSGSERRRDDREYYAIPLRFRPVDSENTEMVEAETLNLSRSGICFGTSRRVSVGESLEMFLTFPNEITGRGPIPMKCDARVVHVQKRPLANGLSGVGATIEQFQPIARGKRRPIPG
ncbi:MAG: PilZ domain-containing protein [Candidatus Acidiferrales bacterium]